MSDQRPKRRWQNLLHRKCPNCDTRLEENRDFFVCPNPDPNGAVNPKNGLPRNCFFIKKLKAAEFLLDPKHPANFCLSAHERETVDQAVQDMGVARA